MRTLFLAVLLTTAAPAFAQSASLAAAHARIAADYDKTVAEVIELTEIPAPPFKETARAQRVLEKFKALGLENVHVDAVGNVIGTRPGKDRAAKALMVAAHLDTVFPPDVPIKVRREGDTLHAPGIGDTTVTVAALITFVRAMDAGKLQTPRDIIFVANVGEEGQGDLRGIRHIFSASPLKPRIGDFISFDGSTVGRITNSAVGSRRYRVAFKGPGGHSYGAFGLVNPMVAMAGTVSGMYSIPIPQDVKTTYAASTIAGGTSVNSIPNLILAEFDMRSASPANLKAVETRFLQIIEESVAAENAARDTRFGKISAVPELIGDRPAGTTPASDPLVQAAAKVLTANGYDATLTASSTDSNIPISLGIPAVTLSAGGGGFRAHALDEYINVERGAFVKGLTTAFDIVVEAAAIKRK
ncbi:M20/M25/M40 family metallo-hydrolase [Sandarakinorhabdus sp. AAP62]|uniref:M20/M25/M40 family metallo-hydrolase n=1 Tax=Sandarakinorhabdus sp. AAP62 TaxID=1248916 RepID=UPI0002D56FD1|nr:M20/M25/M40 family metallo-hydrolase [Sandarakinorhabdus sp. AAP62]